MNALAPIAHSATITLAEAEALHTYARERWSISSVNELFALIDGRDDRRCFYDVMRLGGAK